MMLTADWGPVSSWFAAAGTIAATIVALCAGLGVFNLLLRPRLLLTFEQKEPWCRETRLTSGHDAYWVRARVGNKGGQSARGCIGMVVEVRTDGQRRDDIDPVQLRWAGLPRTRGFDPLDLGRKQRQFVNVGLIVRGGTTFGIETFRGKGFDPGFRTELELDSKQEVDVAVFADNAPPSTLTLTITYGGTFETLKVSSA